MIKNRKVVAVILAAGSGKRIGSRVPKQFIKIAGKTLMEYTIRAFEKSKDIDEIILVTNPGFCAETKKVLARNRYKKLKKVLDGGKMRMESSAIGVDAIEDEDAKVLIHDVARPFVSECIINDCVKALDSHEAVGVAIPSSDTVIKVKDSIIDEIPPRKYMMRMQTPQAFRAGLIKKAHELAGNDKDIDVTDDCALILKYKLSNVLRSPTKKIFILRKGFSVNMKKFIKTLAITVAALAFISFVPVAVLYLRPSPKPYTNEQAIEKLKNNKGEYFEFIVLSDNHAGLIFNDSATLKLIRHMNREDRFKKVPIDFAVISGDVTFRGGAWDYNIFNKTRALIKWPVICAEGNHDDDKGGPALFKKYVGKREFAFSDRNSYFIVIDNIRGDIGEKQFSRLETELNKSLSYQHRFIILHKSPVAPYQQSWYRPELNPWSHRFMKLCEKYKVDIVFSGHEHMFKEQKFGGVRYVVSGGGGMITQLPRSEGGFLHYTVVKVCGDYVSYEVRKTFPPLWEYLLLYMWKDAFYLLKDIVF
jgi:2-C-methyl-D-erythritol 4-phosphate cytidylyltransferase